MPGFNIGELGGVGPSNLTETRRKHRWLFQTIASQSFNMPGSVLLLLQRAARPTFIFDEPELHHDQEVAYFAGKQRWDPITLAFYDSENDPDSSLQMLNWVNSVSQLNATTVAVPREYKSNATLQMTKGDGSVSESWSLAGAWPQQTNWGDLDYTNTEIQLIEVTLRYDRASRG